MLWETSKEGFEMEKNELGETIRNERERLFGPRSQAKVARLLETSAAHLSNIENGKARPGQDMLLRIADVTKLDPKHLLDLAGFAGSEEVLSGSADGSGGSDKSEAKAESVRTALKKLDAISVKILVQAVLGKYAEDRRLQGRQWDVIGLDDFIDSLADDLKMAKGDGGQKSSHYVRTGRKILASCSPFIKLWEELEETRMHCACQAHDIRQQAILRDRN